MCSARIVPADSVCQARSIAPLASIRKVTKSNIRAFHDAVLTRLVPLPVVTAQIDRLIAEDGKGSTQTWSEQPLILNSHVTALPFRATLLPHNRPRECL